jgi:hypothetical protein
MGGLENGAASYYLTRCCHFIDPRARTPSCWSPPPPMQRRERESVTLHFTMSGYCSASSPHVGRAHVFMYSTALTLSSSLHVKGLTWRCYDWNNESYMLILTQLNNQCGTNPTTSLPLLDHLGSNHNYYKATNGQGCYNQPLKGWRPRQHTIYIIGKQIPRISSRCRVVPWG